MRFTLITLAFILFLGGTYFYETKIGEGTGAKKTSLEESLKNGAGEKKNSTSPTSTATGFLVNPFSFLKNQDEETASQPPQEESSQNQTQESADPAKEALKTEIRNYLIASSQVPFPNDKVQLQVALAETEDGNPTGLIKIRDDYKIALELFKKLTPPQELLSIHEKSIQITQDFIALIDDTVYKRKGSVKETWNSEERTRIVNAADAVKQEIRNVVNSYQIDLPPEVLPY